MKDYEQPLVLRTEETAEGVYMASGASESISVERECWTLEIRRDQADAGGYATFRVHGVHSNEVTHISTKTTIVAEFSDTVTGAEFEGFEANVSGNRVTLTRESHANAYYSGDNFDTLLKIWSPNYTSILPLSATITCTHAVNVQGGYD